MEGGKNKSQGRLLKQQEYDTINHMPILREEVYTHCFGCGVKTRTLYRNGEELTTTTICENERCHFYIDRRKIKGVWTIEANSQFNEVGIDKSSQMFSMQLSRRERSNKGYKKNK